MNDTKFKLIFDGNCQICQKSVQELKSLDVFGSSEYINYHDFNQITTLHPSLTKEIADKQIHLVSPEGKIYGGFYAFRRLTLLMPVLYPLVIFLYLPFAGRLGDFFYKWIARRRYLFNSASSCQDNQCSNP